jgi:hypothetical protein
VRDQKACQKVRKQQRSLPVLAVNSLSLDTHPLSQTDRAVAEAMQCHHHDMPPNLRLHGSSPTDLPVGLLPVLSGGVGREAFPSGAVGIGMMHLHWIIGPTAAPSHRSPVRQNDPTERCRPPLRVGPFFGGSSFSVPAAARARHLPLCRRNMVHVQVSEIMQVD